MKLTNEQLIEIFRAADLAFSVARFNQDNDGRFQIERRDSHIHRVREFAESLRDQLETESLQLGDANKKAEPVSEPYKFEVGGDASVLIDEPNNFIHGKIIGLNERLVWVQDKYGEVYSFTYPSIAEYTPPVRVKAWCCAGYVSNNPATVNAWNDNGTAVAGYWTPEAK